MVFVDVVAVIVVVVVDYDDDDVVVAAAAAVVFVRFGFGLIVFNIGSGLLFLKYYL